MRRVSFCFTLLLEGWEGRLPSAKTKALRRKRGKIVFIIVGMLNFFLHPSVAVSGSYFLLEW